MNFLEQKIVEDGCVKPGNILKVDTFLNHQIDVDITRQIAEELHRRFEGKPVTKILTIEASGIAIAYALAEIYDVPIVFAKKAETANSTDDKYMSCAFSYTHKQMNRIYVSKPFLSASDQLLIVDDFLAEGEAMTALTDIARQAGASVQGLGVAIAKGQQGGMQRLRSQGYQVEAVAVIDYMNWQTGTITFQ